MNQRVIHRIRVCTLFVLAVGLVLEIGGSAFSKHFASLAAEPDRVAEKSNATARLSPTQVRWDAGKQAFAVWASGTRSWIWVSAAGDVIARDTAADVPDTVTCQIVLADGSQARVDPWQPQLIVVTKDRSRTIPLPSRPMSVAAIPGTQKVLVVCDSIPERQVCLVDLTAEGPPSIAALPGVSNVRDVAVSPDGKRALITHLLPKSNLPSSQIEQGWVFTNALTMVSLHDKPVPDYTVPLDLRTTGFANPQGIAWSPDGSRVYVAQAGADVLSVLDVSKMDAAGAAYRSASGAYDLTKTRQYVRARIPTGANPWGVAISTKGNVVAVANRLDDSLSLIDARTNLLIKTVPLSEQNPEPDLVRTGERLFHSGRLSFSGQFSCASCHPDGHSDGLNWDLPADGFNNFQNTKSLLDVDGTSPYGWQGKSATLAERFTGTLQHLFQHEPTPEETAALSAYLAHLKYPASLPPREPRDSAAAGRGRELFIGTGGCSACHAGAKLTDRARHDLGLGGEFDTPSLVRVSETAPYLHDGRAPTLESIFRQHNREHLHGQILELTDDQWQDLSAYLRSL